LKTCIVLGSKSDIAQGLTLLLREDGWKVVEWCRGIGLPESRFDLVIVAMGRVAPVGMWWDQPYDEWEECIDSNLLTPFRLLQRLWPQHNEGASVCFMAGSNPNMIMDGYSAYNVSKMGLLKLCEQLDHETPDAKFFALGPGTILTKIHDATVKAKWDNPKLDKVLFDPPEWKPTIKRVYDCLMWCIAQKKEVIGGRNICVSDPWEKGTTNWANFKNLSAFLKHYPDTFKLRREEL